MKARVRTRIADALAFANASPFPEISELNTDVYA
jgi:TPP-dependent pyruvate/acetoin dehydrogenase alpha subunit